MPVLGIVLILDDREAETRERVLRAAGAMPEVTLGEPAEHRVPAVLEVGSSAAAEGRVDALRDLDGVAIVDVVYVDFEDLVARPAPRGAREDSQWNSTVGNS